MEMMSNAVNGFAAVGAWARTNPVAITPAPTAMTSANQRPGRVCVCITISSRTRSLDHDEAGPPELGLLGFRLEYRNLHIIASGRQVKQRHGKSERDDAGLRVPPL